MHASAQKDIAVTCHEQLTHLLHVRVANARAHAGGGVAAGAGLAAGARLGTLRPEASGRRRRGKREGGGAVRVVALAVPQLPGVLQQGEMKFSNFRMPSLNATYIDATARGSTAAGTHQGLRSTVLTRQVNRQDTLPRACRLVGTRSGYPDAHAAEPAADNPLRLRLQRQIGLEEFVQRARIGSPAGAMHTAGCPPGAHMPAAAAPPPCARRSTPPDRSRRRACTAPCGTWRGAAAARARRG